MKHNMEVTVYHKDLGKITIKNEDDSGITDEELAEEGITFEEALEKVTVEYREGITKFDAFSMESIEYGRIVIPTSSILAITINKK